MQNVPGFSLANPVRRPLLTATQAARLKQNNNVNSIIKFKGHRIISKRSVPSLSIQPVPVLSNIPVQVENVTDLRNNLENNLKTNLTENISRPVPETILNPVYSFRDAVQQTTSPELETKKIPVEYDKDTGMLIFPCPHCDSMITVGVNEVNCCIFRHGYFYRVVNGQIVLLQQMNPHTPKQECDRLKAENKIVGCGKPFRIDMENCKRYVSICGYI